jgi:hypothetical protein
VNRPNQAVPHRAVVLVSLLLLAAVVAHGAAQAQTPAGTQTGSRSKLWVVVGGGHNTISGDCTFCEEAGREPRYSNSGSVLVDVGARLNPKTDVGVELVWAPGTTAEGSDFRTTFVAGVAQFRPWESSGFFVKAGMGMAFVRNWLFEDDPFTQKALAVAIGGGWAFRTQERLGFQLYASQHVAALGDFQLREGTLENVMGNFWSLGAAVVIR